MSASVEPRLDNTTNLFTSQSFVWIVDLVPISRMFHIEIIFQSGARQSGPLQSSEIRSEIIMLLRQLSYAIKKQAKYPNNGGILCSKAPYSSLVLYGIRELA